jgi:hypothetical protein
VDRRRALLLRQRCVLRDGAGAGLRRRRPAVRRRSRAAGAARAAAEGAAGTRDLSARRPERRADRGRPARLQPLGDDAAGRPGRREVFQRAVAACMDARGYSVR